MPPRIKKTLQKASRRVSSVKVQVWYQSKKFQKRAPEHLANSYQTQADKLKVIAVKCKYDLDRFNRLFLQIWEDGPGDTSSARPSPSSRAETPTASGTESATCPLRFTFKRSELLANVPAARVAGVEDAQRKLRVQAQKEGWTLATFTLKWRNLIYEHGGTVPAAERAGLKRVQIRHGKGKRIRAGKLSPVRHANLYSRLEPLAEAAKKEQQQEAAIQQEDSDEEDASPSQWDFLHDIECHSVDEPLYNRVCACSGKDPVALKRMFQGIVGLSDASAWSTWGPSLGAARTYKVTCQDCNSERVETYIFNGVNIDPWLLLEDRLVPFPEYTGNTYGRCCREDGEYGYVTTRATCHVTYATGRGSSRRPNPWLQPSQTLPDVLCESLGTIEEMLGGCDVCETDGKLPAGIADVHKCLGMYFWQDTIDWNHWDYEDARKFGHVFSKLRAELQEIRWPEMLCIRFGSYALHGNRRTPYHPHCPVVFPWKFGPCNGELRKFNLDKDYNLVAVELLDERYTFYKLDETSDLGSEHRWYRLLPNQSSVPATQSEVYSRHAQTHVVTLYYQRSQGASETIEAAGSGACVSLGEAVTDVPPEVHADMVCLAKLEIVPPSTPELRRANKDHDDKRIVPAVCLAANRYGYIGPKLPAPPGWLWKFTKHERKSSTNTDGWILIRDAGSKDAAKTLKEMEAHCTVESPPFYFSSLIRDQPVDLIVTNPMTLRCEKYDSVAYNKKVKPRHAEATKNLEPAFREGWLKNQKKVPEVVSKRPLSQTSVEVLCRYDKHMFYMKCLHGEHKRVLREADELMAKAMGLHK